MTPIPQFEEGCPYKGGFREERLIISVSGWDYDVIDLMFALMFYKAINEEIRFHHVGFRHPNQDSFTHGIAESQRIYGCQALHLPAPDHDRYYVPVETNLIPNGMFWIEHQLWPKEEDRYPSVHFDKAMLNPETYIQYIARYTGLRSVLWTRQKNSPCAMVEAMQANGLRVAFMARPEWTSVDSW